MNEIAYQEKIAEVSKTIYSYCLSKTSTREDAEDLSQDILLELTKSVGNIRNDKAFYAFMWGVAGNVYKQWCRKQKKISHVNCPKISPMKREFRMMAAVIYIFYAAN